MLMMLMAQVRSSVPHVNIEVLKPIKIICKHLASV